MFSSKPQTDLFGSKKDDPKPSKPVPSGGSLFSGLGVKGKPQAKDIPAAEYSPPSLPQSSPLPKSEPVYTPPTLPVSKTQPVTDFPMPPTVPELSNPSSSNHSRGSSTSDTLKPSDSELPAQAKPAENLQGTETGRPKTGLFATMKLRQAENEESAKKFVSKKREDFGAELAGKPASDFRGKPDLEMKSNPESKSKPEPDSFPLRDESPTFAKARVLDPYKSLQEERTRADKSQKEKEDREERERMDRERRAAEEKERQRYQNPELLTAWVEERLSIYAKQQEEKNKKQVELLAETAKLQEKLNNLHTRKTRTVEQQEQAASEEDYELAEKLNQVIKDMDLVIVQTNTEILKTTSLYQSYESDKTEIYASQQKFLSEVQAHALDHKTAEETDLEKFKTERTKQEAALQKQLSDESERLDKERSRLELDASALEQEREETQSHIAQHTQDLLHEKSEAEIQLKTLEQEIAELEALLKAKRSQREALLHTVSDCDTQIKERMSAFQDELYTVDLKVRKLDQAKTKAGKDTEALENAKGEYEAQCAGNERESQNRDLRIRLLTACLDDLKQRQERLERQAKVREQFLEKIEGNSKLLKEKQEQLREAEEYGKTVKESAENIRHRFVQKTDRLSELEVKIPKLDAEKKAYATAKQYKDAGRLANEVKIAITEREALLEEIEKVRLEVTEQDQHLSDVRTPLD